MDKRRQRNESEMQALISELQVLKRKLLSKSEALLIISKDLDATQKERDQYKLMAERLRVRCQAYKRQLSEFPLNRDQATLIQMLRDMKNQKMAHQRQSETLQQKLNEALGDVKLLRERFARQRIGDEGVGPRHFPAHEREKLVLQLEGAKQQAEQYRMELNSANDENAEIRLENKEFREKAERLNNELNFMLNGDKKRIIDIDALCMENKYLQDRVTQCQEEKNTLHAQISKLKSALNARKSAQSEIKVGRMRSSSLVISPKQIKEILANGSGLPSSTETVADLQSIAAALLETINDKNLALHHLRNTNKILGNRVAELERKLRTLEVAGLWSTTSDPRPVSSTPKVKVHDTSKESGQDEFISSLGSRLSKLTDVCSKSFDEYKLVSLTPESSGSDSVTPVSDVMPGLHNGIDDVTSSNDVTTSNDVTPVLHNGIHDVTTASDVTTSSHVINNASVIDGSDVILSQNDVTDDVINSTATTPNQTPDLAPKGSPQEQAENHTSTTPGTTANTEEPSGATENHIQEPHPLPTFHNEDSTVKGATVMGSSMDAGTTDLATVASNSEFTEKTASLSPGRKLGEED